MSAATLFYPVLAQVLLTFSLLFAMGRGRTRYLRESRTHPAKVALGENVYPVDVQQKQNAFHNQLEMPILFYAVSLFAIAFNKVDMILVALAWAFVAARLAHALVHVGSNRVPQRAALFAVGMLLLLSMWVWLAIRIAT